MKSTILSLLVAAAVLCAQAQNTHQVTNLNDSGPGSLRQTIINSVSGDTIDLRDLEGTILLESPITMLSRAVHIVGPGKDKLKISGQDATRIFTITTVNNRPMSITDVSIINGHFDDFGGCMHASGGGRLTLRKVEFKDCSCTRTERDQEALGGALSATTDSLIIEQSQFSGNTARNTDGRSSGGAVHTQVTHLTIDASTFVNNASIATFGFQVAALSIRPRLTGGDCTFQINNSTFSANAGSFVVEASKAFATTVSTLTGIVKNSTFAFNTGVIDVLSSGHRPNEEVDEMRYGNCLFTSNGVCGPEEVGSYQISLGANVIECIDGLAVPLGDFLSSAVLVNPLADNGGPTLTHALKEGTIAINNGSDENPPLYDQRGQPRVQKGQIDIGAYESAFNSFSADFTFTSDCNGLTEFLNTSVDPNEDIATYSWNFGDGTTSSEKDPTHQFANGGNYTVQLVVTSASNQTSTTEKTLAIDGLPPVIQIVGNNPVSLFVNQPYQDEGATAFDQVDGDLTANIVTTSNVVTSTPGSYTVVYTVSDSCGFISSATREVDVLAIPYPSIDLGADKIICAGDSLRLDAGTGHSSYRWSTGEITSSILITSSGSYTVTVTNHYNFSSSDSVLVTVVPLPQPMITAEVVACENALSLSVPTFASYEWSTGSTAQSITATQNGIYAVTVTDSTSCQGTDQINIKLNPGSACEQNNTILPPTLTSVCSDLPVLLRRWRITNPNPTSLRVDWEIVNSIEKSWIDIPPGVSVLTTITVPLNTNILKIYWHNGEGELQSLQQSSNATRCQRSSTSSTRVATTTEGTDKISQLSAYPNPGKSRITVEVESGQESETDLQVISLSGVVQSRSSVRLAEGSNFIVHDISMLPPGSYVIKVGFQTMRFAKE